MRRHDQVRTLQGGCWKDGSWLARCTSSDGCHLSGLAPFIGFRLTRIVSPLGRLADAGRDGGKG